MQIYSTFEIYTLRWEILENYSDQIAIVPLKISVFGKDYLLRFFYYYLFKPQQSNNLNAQSKFIILAFATSANTRFSNLCFTFKGERYFLKEKAGLKWHLLNVRKDRSIRHKPDWQLKEKYTKFGHSSKFLRPKCHSSILGVKQHSLSEQCQGSCYNKDGALNWISLSWIPNLFLKYDSVTNKIPEVNVKSIQF